AQDATIDGCDISSCAYGIGYRLENSGDVLDLHIDDTTTSSNASGDFEDLGTADGTLNTSGNYFNLDVMHGALELHLVLPEPRDSIVTPPPLELGFVLPFEAAVPEMPGPTTTGTNNQIHNAIYGEQDLIFLGTGDSIQLRASGPRWNTGGAPAGQYVYEGTGPPGSATNPHIFANYITPTLTIYDPHIVIRNCEVHGVTGDTNAKAIRQNNGATHDGLVVQDCEIMNGSRATGLNRVHVLRCDCHDMWSGCFSSHSVQSNCRYEANWVHQLGRNPGDPHADSFQCRGLDTNIEIVGNYFDVHQPTSLDWPGPGGGVVNADATWFLEADQGIIRNVLIQGNWAKWGNVLCRFGGGAQLYNVDVRDNYISHRGTAWGQSAIQITGAGSAPTPGYVEGFPGTPPQSQGVYAYSNRWWNPGGSGDGVLIPLSGNPLNGNCGNTINVNFSGPAPPDPGGPCGSGQTGRSVFPATLETEFAIPASTVAAGAAALPRVLELELFIPPLSVSKGIPVAPAPVELLLEIQSPTVTADAAAAPDTLELVLEVPEPAVTGSVAVFPDSLELALELTEPLIEVGANDTSGPLEVVFEIPTPTVVGEAVALPDTVEALLDLPPPIV
ncbi:MAG: hypothetical protein GY733_16815, partial [bacterium]|nr:hypothetical protein [bacterium]